MRIDSANYVQILIDGSPAHPGKVIAKEILKAFGKNPSKGFHLINIAELLSVTYHSGRANWLDDETIIQIADKCYSIGVSAGYTRFLWVGMGKNKNQIDWLIEQGVIKANRCKILLIEESLEAVLRRLRENDHEKVRRNFPGYQSRSWEVKQTLTSNGIRFEILNGEKYIHEIADETLLRIKKICPIPKREDIFRKSKLVRRHLITYTKVYPYIKAK